MVEAARTVSTVDKSLQVMLSLSRRPGEWGVSELSRHIGQGRSGIHSILQTLLARGFVEQDTRTKRYRLGSAILVLAQAMTPRADLGQIARGPMQALAIATGECAYLLVPSGNMGITIHRAEPPEVMRVTTEVGSFSPLHAGSNPKAILAFLPPDAVERYLAGPLEGVTPRTPCEPATVAAELSEVRRLGYAYTEEELFEDIAGIAAPIFNLHGDVCGSVGVGGLVPRIRTNRDEITRRVLTAGQAISALLGYHQPFER